MSQATEELALDELAGAFAERLFGATMGTTDLLLIDLGTRLGFYQALVDGGPANSSELAERTGTAERYVREWLNQQGVSGILVADEPGAADDVRSYSLPPAHAEVLLNTESLVYGGALARFPSFFGGIFEWFEDAFRSGQGIPYERYGADAVDIQAQLNYPMFRNLLTQAWLPSLPEVHARLQTPGTRVLDIACGAGAAAIEIARAYPEVTVDGIDLDETSIAAARRNAAGSEVGDRVRFEVLDGGGLQEEGAYNLITVFESIHDMSDPVATLGRARAALAEGGWLVIAETKAGESFAEPSPLEPFFYGISVLYCLPHSLAEQPSAGIGTVIRPAKVRSLAADAGFSRVEVLPIEHDFWHFYRLVP